MHAAPVSGSNSSKRPSRVDELLPTLYDMVTDGSDDSVSRTTRPL